MYASAVNLWCGFTDPGLHKICPRSTPSLSTPRNKAPTLSPACPESRSLRNISTPVQTVFVVSRIPTISISSPTLTTPRSIRPVTTVPRPEIENTSSIGIKNGWSIARTGVGIYSSTAAISSLIFSSPISGVLPSIAAKAEPATTGISSPGYSYEDKSSRISISTSSSNSSSST